MKKNITPIERIFPEIAGIYYWEKNIDSLFMGANEEFIKAFSTFKFSQDLLGMNDFDFFEETMASSYQAQDNEVILTKRSVRIIELIQSKTMESPKLCITTKTPKFNEDGIIKGSIGYCLDLTDSLTKLGQFLLKHEKTNMPNLNFYHIGQRVACNIKLSPRESECLFFVLRHKTAKEIAKYLGNSPRTIEEHIKNIKEKFNVTSKSELFDKAEEHGFFSVIPEQIFTKERFLVFKET
jgi:DNA-binding CsgD family transcriptional regulator